MSFDDDSAASPASASSSSSSAQPDGRPPRPLVSACAVLGLEAVALIGLAVFLLIDTATGAASSLAGALLGAALVLGCAAALLFGARGLLRCQPGARTPIVVLQVLAIPVAYSLGFQAGRLAVGGPMLLAALAVLYLLFTPPSRAALDRERF